MPTPDRNDTPTDPPLITPESTIWQAGGVLPFTPLDRDLTCDVCVVGGGGSGLCVAHALAKAGASVVVLDATALGMGQTAHSTAHLVTALDERFYTLEHRHGPRAVALAAAAHAAAIDWIERTVADEGISCGLRRLPGYLAVPPERRDDLERLIALEHAAAESAGARCKRLGHAPPLFIGLGDDALCFGRQAELHPVQFLAGLAQSVVRRGGQVFGQTHVKSCRGDPDRVEVVTDAGHRVDAGAAVLATHDLPAELRPRLRRTRAHATYVAAYEVPDEPDLSEDHLLLWDGYWDDHTPYHYVRFVPGPLSGSASRHLLLVGGEDTATEEPDDPLARYAALDAWTKTHAPWAGPRMSQWSGRIHEPDGEFALIGPVPDAHRVYVVGGDSGNGLTYAAIAARVLTRLITSPASPPAEDERLYSPAPRSPTAEP